MVTSRLGARPQRTATGSHRHRTMEGARRRLARFLAPRRGQDAALLRRSLLGAVLHVDGVRTEAGVPRRPSHVDSNRPGAYAPARALLAGLGAVRTRRVHGDVPR